MIRLRVATPEAAAGRSRAGREHRPAHAAPARRRSPRSASRSVSPRSSRCSASRPRRRRACSPQIDQLGTNLLTVTNGQTLFGNTAELPLAAPGMIARIGPVTQVADTGSTSANVYRSPLIPSVNTNALQVQAATLGLLPVVGATVARGRYLNAATAHRAGLRARRRRQRSCSASTASTPASGSGSAACGSTSPGSSAPRRSRPRSTAPCSSASRRPKRYLGFDGHPTTIYVRTRDEPDRGGRSPCSPLPPTPNRRTRSTSASPRPR